MAFFWLLPPAVLLKAVHFVYATSSFALAFHLIPNVAAPLLVEVPAFVE
jgi:hypothetical protein